MQKAFTELCSPACCKALVWTSNTCPSILAVLISPGCAGTWWMHDAGWCSIGAVCLPGALLQSLWDLATVLVTKTDLAAA